MAAYQEVQVTSRSPLELVVMLYDGALSALRQAHGAMSARDLAAKRGAVTKALQIVQHLQSSLNMEEGADVAANLDTLYRDVITRIVEANVQGNPALLEEAIRLLEPVRDAWAAIAAPAAAPADPSSPVAALDR
jgi:flagellar protein FliS